MKLKRYTDNPILKPNKFHKWESKAVFNPGVVFHEGKIHMLYRAIGDYEYYVSRLGYAYSKDGIKFKRFKRPVFTQERKYERYGFEDPRITKIKNKIYVTYVVLSKYANKPNPFPQIAIASTDDFRHFNRLGRITPKDAEDKDLVLFPEKINNKYMVLHRPYKWVGVKYNVKIPSIWIADSKYLKRLWSPKQLFKPKEDWEKVKVGSGCPPIKTNKGWLVIYHGVDKKMVYRVGAFLLDLKNPKKIIGKLREPILEPKKRYEREGFKKKVVFPTGAIIKEENLLVYYGCADKRISLAYCNLEELLNLFKK